MPEIIKDSVDPGVKARAGTDSSARVLALFEGMYEQNILRHQDAQGVSGLKFELPELPLPPGSHLKYRYEPIVDQITNLLMVDGKKATARRVGSLVRSFADYAESALLTITECIPYPQAPPDRTSSAHKPEHATPTYHATSALSALPTYPLFAVSDRLCCASSANTTAEGSSRRRSGGSDACAVDA